MIRKGFLDKGFQQFHRDAKLCNSIVDTQEEVFGSSIVDNYNWDGYLKFLDIVKGRVNKKAQPYTMFSNNGKANPVCPLCGREIIGIDLLLDFCKNAELAAKIRQDFESKKDVPTQCPSGHFLFYSWHTGTLKERDRSEVDDYIDEAKKSGYLPSVWR